jgi:ribosomal protein L16/L10AE
VSGGPDRGSSSPLPRKLGIKPGHRLLLLGAPEGFELDGVPEDVAREALRLGAAKLPVRTRFIQRIAE